MTDPFSGRKVGEVVGQKGGSQRKMDKPKEKARKETGTFGNENFGAKNQDLHVKKREKRAAT